MLMLLHIHKTGMIIFKMGAVMLRYDKESYVNAKAATSENHKQ